MSTTIAVWSREISRYPEFDRGQQNGDPIFRLTVILSALLLILGAILPTRAQKPTSGVCAEWHRLKGSAA